MIDALPAAPIRRTILSALPEQSTQFDERPPEPRFLYVPTAHIRALSFDTMLVQGIRGAGKSLWSAALQSPAHRAQIANVLGPRVLDEQTEVVSGFGAAKDPDSYPGSAALEKLLGAHRPACIWRAVMLHHALTPPARAALGAPWLKGGFWEDRVPWVTAHPEHVDQAMYQRDRALEQEGRRKLVVFDALEHTSSDWRDRRILLRGLLMVLLEMRSFRHLRAKAFVRPDMLDSPEVAAFPDASKIITNDVRLTWPRTDLFGLFWQRLANADDGEVFRDACRQRFGVRFEREDDTFCVPEPVRGDEHLQRLIFHAITGPYMGSDRRRGLPYTWLPGHLADTLNQVSPRSFLAALRRAASEVRAEHPYALSYESIKTGVQAASKIRVEEVAEDSPWVRIAVEALEDLVLPCTFIEIERRWESVGVLSALAREKHRPQRLEEGPEGVRRDLEELGFFERMSDGRVNMPDVYRVGFGLRRKGGVRPVR